MSVVYSLQTLSIHFLSTSTYFLEAVDSGELDVEASVIKWSMEDNKLSASQSRGKPAQTSRSCAASGRACPAPAGGCRCTSGSGPWCSG